MATSIYELGYELTRAALAEQEKRLSDLRARTGTILAVVSIAGSFLIFKGGHVDGLTVAAIVAYLLVIGAAIYVLLPHELTLEFKGSVLVDVAETSKAPLEDMYQVATSWLERFHEKNQQPLKKINRVFLLACGALGMDILLWTLSTVGTL